MRRLLTFLLVLCLPFSAFTGAAILIGQRQPLPEHLALLHLTDCAPPCWIGIMPGVTTLEEALPRIKARYANLPDYQTIFSGSLTTATIQVSNAMNPDDKFSINIYADNNGRVNTIGFDTYGSRSSPNVGELFSILGPPTSVLSKSSALYDGITTYTMAFSAHDCITAATVPYPDNFASIFQQPSSFYFGERGGCDAQDRQPPWQPWRGFTAFGDDVR